MSQPTNDDALLGAAVAALPPGTNLAHMDNGQWRVRSANRSELRQAGQRSYFHVGPEIDQAGPLVDDPLSAINAAVHAAGLEKTPDDATARLGELVRQMPIGWTIAHRLNGRWRVASFTQGGNESLKNLVLEDGDDPLPPLTRALEKAP